jgi:hypothetical protein
MEITRRGNVFGVFHFAFFNTIRFAKADTAGLRLRPFNLEAA